MGTNPTPRGNHDFLVQKDKSIGAGFASQVVKAGVFGKYLRLCGQVGCYKLFIFSEGLKPIFLDLPSDKIGEFKLFE